MKNIEIAEIFYQIADFLEMDEVSFRSRAYERAGRHLESLEKDVEVIYKEEGLKGLKKIEGIGQGLALAIEDYLKTGVIRDFEKLKKKCPVKLDELTAIEGLGPKMIKVLYKKLGIKNLKDLEKAAKDGQIKKLERFGEKTEKNILQGIKFAKKDKGRFLLGMILPTVRDIIQRLESLPAVQKISPAGSVRRMKETVGDVDILVVSSQPAKVMDYFVQMPGVVKVWAKGPTRSSIRFATGFDCDLRVIKKESFGSALQYFTGNKYHNILTRRIAISQGLKLNEYGVFRKQKKIAGQTEKEVYQAIGLPYIEPEMRENTGEIEAALRQTQDQPNGLPKIIGYNDLKGDCHIHTTWSEGSKSIEVMAKVVQKMGRQYMVVTDHAKDAVIANGMDEKKLTRQMQEIDKINKKFKSFKILKGCEVNIRSDGSLDIADEVLAKLDIVVAAVHSKFKMSQSAMTKRIIQAMENPYVSIIAHPTGRVILHRPAYSLDFEQIFKAAKKTKTALEINAYPARLDLKDSDIKKAVAAGVKLVISTDAHSPLHLSYAELGIAMARRGWAEKKDVLNTLTTQKFLEYFRKR